MLLSCRPNPLRYSFIPLSKAPPGNDSFIKFELDRLIDYDDDEIIAEIQRVSALVPEGTFSRRLFEEHSRVSSKTARRRFGTREAALERARIRARYSGKTVTEKQLQPIGRQMTNDELLAEL